MRGGTSVNSGWVQSKQMRTTRARTGQTRTTRGRARRILTKVLVYGTLALGVLVVLFPLYYLFVSSIRPGNATMGELWPSKLNWENWKYLFGLQYLDTTTNQVRQPEFPTLLWLFNSVKVSSITAFLTVCLATTGAYALSRFRFAGRRFGIVALLFLQLFPSVMSMVALYLMLDFIGQYIPWLGLNTHGGLILVYLGGVPFQMWLMKGYFDTMPKDMEEAAQIDGCNRWQAFYRVLLPLSVPIIAVVAILVFVGTFSDFLLPSVIIRDQDKLTYAVGLRTLGGSGFGVRWGVFSAGGLLGGIPIAAFFLLAQRYLVSGLARGGVKG